MITSNGLTKLGFILQTDFAIKNDGQGAYISEWNSNQPQPSESAIEAAHAEWQTEYDDQAYARTREASYPSTQDFMEAYTEKEIGSDSTKWDAYVIAYNKVRTDNPK